MEKAAWATPKPNPSSNLQEQRADPSAQKRPPDQLTFLWQMSSPERGGDTLAETEEDAWKFKMR